MTDIGKEGQDAKGGPTKRERVPPPPDNAEPAELGVYPNQPSAAGCARAGTVAKLGAVAAATAAVPGSHLLSR